MRIKKSKEKKEREEKDKQWARAAGQVAMGTLTHFSMIAVNQYAWQQLIAHLGESLDNDEIRGLLVTVFVPIFEEAVKVMVAKTAGHGANMVQLGYEQIEGLIWLAQNIEEDHMDMLPSLVSRLALSSVMHNTSQRYAHDVAQTGSVATSSILKGVALHSAWNSLMYVMVDSNYIIRPAMSHLCYKLASSLGIKSARGISATHIAAVTAAGLVFAGLVHLLSHRHAAPSADKAASATPQPKAILHRFDQTRLDRKQAASAAHQTPTLAVNHGSYRFMM